MREEVLGYVIEIILCDAEVAKRFCFRYVHRQAEFTCQGLARGAQFRGDLPNAHFHRQRGNGDILTLRFRYPTEGNDSDRNDQCSDQPTALSLRQLSEIRHDGSFTAIIHDG